MSVGDAALISLLKVYFFQQFSEKVLSISNEGVIYTYNRTDILQVIIIFHWNNLATCIEHVT